MSFKVTKKLWTILLTNLIDLSKFAVVEEDVASTTVNTLDVHSKRHDDLEVRILGLVISHPYFYSFVRDLDHFEIIFHFLFEFIKLLNSFLRCSNIACIIVSIVIFYFLNCEFPEIVLFFFQLKLHSLLRSKGWSLDTEPNTFAGLR